MRRACCAPADDVKRLWPKRILNMIHRAGGRGFPYLGIDGGGGWVARRRPIYPGSPAAAAAGACRLLLETACDVIDDAWPNIAPAHRLGCSPAFY